MHEYDIRQRALTEAHRLLQGRVWGDAGYQGVAKREENEGLEVANEAWETATIGALQR